MTVREASELARQCEELRLGVLQVSAMTLHADTEASVTLIVLAHDLGLAVRRLRGFLAESSPVAAVPAGEPGPE